MTPGNVATEIQDPGMIMGDPFNSHVVQPDLVPAYQENVQDHFPLVPPPSAFRPSAGQRRGLYALPAGRAIAPPTASRAGRQRLFPRIRRLLQAADHLQGLSLVDFLPLRGELRQSVLVGGLP